MIYTNYLVSLQWQYYYFEAIVSVEPTPNLRSTLRRASDLNVKMAHQISKNKTAHKANKGRF